MHRQEVANGISRLGCVLTCLLACCGGSSCGRDVAPVPPGGAGSTDGGALPDARPLFDAGRVVDAAAPLDAGQNADAAPPFDAGSLAHGSCTEVVVAAPDDPILCQGIEFLMLSNPIIGASGDSGLAPGGAANVTIDLTNVGPSSFDRSYPCVGLEVDAAAARIVGDNPARGAQSVFGIGAGETDRFSFDLELRSTLSPGASLGFVAFVSTAGVDCTRVHNLSFSVTFP